MELRDKFDPIPTSIEEAKEAIISNDEDFAKVLTAANINAIATILILKGITTKEEFSFYFEQSQEACLTLAAEKIMEELSNIS